MVDVTRWKILRLDLNRAKMYIVNSFFVRKIFIIIIIRIYIECLCTFAADFTSWSARGQTHISSTTDYPIRVTCMYKIIGIINNPSLNCMCVMVIDYMCMHASSLSATYVDNFAVLNVRFHNILMVLSFDHQRRYLLAMRTQVKFPKSINNYNKLDVVSW